MQTAHPAIYAAIALRRSLLLIALSANVPQSYMAYCPVYQHCGYRNHGN
jgi:hypothetical protein